MEAHRFREDLVRISQDDQGKEGHMQIFDQALIKGQDIIIDRMNFNKPQRERYLGPARFAGYNTRIVVLHVPKDICLERCNNRKDHPTIKDSKDASQAVDFFFKNYERVSDDEANEVMRLGWVDKFAPECIYSDIDGTIANIEHRIRYIRPVIEDKEPRLEGISEEPQKFKKDWKAFFEKMALDKVDVVCKSILDSFCSIYPIVYATGRPDNYKQETETWLEENGVRYPGSLLFMRARNDMRKDDVIKEIILEFEIKTRYNILFALDDRDCVVGMLRRHGVKVLQVEKGDF